MQITVLTDEPNRFHSEVRQELHARGVVSTHADDFMSAHIDGARISWKRLSAVQFITVEDTAVRKGLSYDGAQEEAIEASKYLLDQVVYFNLQAGVVVFGLGVTYSPDDTHRGTVIHDDMTFDVEKIPHERLGWIWVAEARRPLPDTRYHLLLNGLWSYSFPFDKPEGLARVYKAYVDRGTDRVSLSIGEQEIFFVQPLWAKVSKSIYREYRGNIEQLSEVQRQALREYVGLMLWQQVQEVDGVFVVTVAHIRNVEGAMHSLLETVKTIREKFSSRLDVRISLSV